MGFFKQNYLICPYSISILNSPIMSQAIDQKIASWLNGNFDTATKEEILALQANQPDALQDAFYKNLEYL